MRAAVSPIVDTISGQELYRILFERDSETRSAIDDLIGLEGRLEFCNSIGRIYFELKPLFEFSLRDDERLLPSWYLLWKTANDLTGCYQLLRLGYYGMAWAHMRAIVEGAAAALYVARNDHARQEYEKGRLDTKAAIRHHTRLYPGTREVYSELHRFTHPSAVTLGSAVGQSDSHTVIGAGYIPEKDWVYRTTFDLLTGICRIIRTTCYLVFPQYMHLGSTAVFKLIPKGDNAPDDTIDDWLRDMHQRGKIDFRAITTSGVEILRPPSPNAPEPSSPKVYGKVALTTDDETISKVAGALPALSKGNRNEMLLLRQLATAAELEGSLLYCSDPVILGAAGPILRWSGLQVCLPSEVQIILRDRL